MQETVPEQSKLSEPESDAQAHPGEKQKAGKQKAKVYEYYAHHVPR